MNQIEKIKKQGLCLGCGLCESLGKEYGVKMELSSDGFYYPYCTLSNKNVYDFTNKIAKICPGINFNLTKYSGLWGEILSLNYAWASDEKIRKDSSSGGVVTALCLYLLEQNKVNAILHVGVVDDQPLYNELSVSRTRFDVIKKSTSRYAPALVFNRIIEILSSTDDVFAFVGKPCDIMTVKQLIEQYPEFKTKIKYFIAIVCAGIPSYNGTLKLLEESNQKNEPEKIRYRGNGWPGYFTANYKDGYTFSKNYNDSWGKVLGRYVHFRCKICPDGIGLFSDIVTGDAWITNNGYPDFKEGDGRNFLMSRTNSGETLVKEAAKLGYLELEHLSLKLIGDMQPFQLNRRKTISYKIIPVWIMSRGLIKFKNIGIWQSFYKTSIFKGIRTAIGTAIRYNKIKE